jgi:hypothetical protein
MAVVMHATAETVHERWKELWSCTSVSVCLCVARPSRLELVGRISRCWNRVPRWTRARGIWRQSGLERGWLKVCAGLLGGGGFERVLIEGWVVGSRRGRDRLEAVVGEGVGEGAEVGEAPSKLLQNLPVVAVVGVEDLV